MEFRSAIVDECGDVMYWCDQLSRDEEIEILLEHPEWTTRCFEV